MSIGSKVAIVAKRVWRGWVRAANSIDADPFTMIAPLIFVLVGFMVLLLGW